MAWEIPKIDWNTNPKSPQAVDFNRIEGNTAFLLNEIEVKKGSLVNAINEKQNLVTIESSYADMANAIGVLNDNPRFVIRVGKFELIPPIRTVSNNSGYVPSSTSIRCTIGSLPFQPHRIYVFIPSVRCRMNNDSFVMSPPYSIETWGTFDFQYNSNVGGIRPNSVYGSFFIESAQIGNILTTSNITASWSSTSNSATLTITNSTRTDGLAFTNGQNISGVDATFYIYGQDG